MSNCFDLEEWLPHFSLDPNEERYRGRIINGPCDICNNELLRRALRDQYDWGAAVPVDVFVMAEGEPEHRDVTKIGGLPYRSAGQNWPVSDEGRPLTFLAQI